MSDISVIIPTLNEEKYIGALLKQLQSCPKVQEIIVSDGGSTDGTHQIAMEHPKVKWVSSPRGRATQMNSGAGNAKGDIFLFLHADSTVDLAGINAIIPTLSQNVAAGCFYLIFNRNGFWLSIYSRVSKYNRTIFTYGDQGLFIKKSLFEKIKGFKEIAIMEDIDIVRRIKREGKFEKLNYPIVTCARRFKKNGVVSQQIRNVCMVCLFYLGVSPNWLSKFYKY